MKNKTAKQIVAAYRTKCVLIGIAYAIALGILILVMNESALIGIVGIVVLGVSLRAPFEKIRETDLESVIYEDLDPEKFSEILNMTRLGKSSRHVMLLYMSSGRHDEILKHIEENAAKTIHPVDKCNNLYREGYVYFERGEYEKLPPIVKKYERIKKENPKIAYVLENFTVFDKFDAFADDDFEYVVDVCDIDLNENTPKKQNHKLTRINVGFYRAVSLYKLAKLNEARAGFEDVIAFAPKMYKAKLSRNFIELIDKEKNDKSRES